jgi:hypothetical protein
MGVKEDFEKLVAMCVEHTPPEPEKWLPILKTLEKVRAVLEREGKTISPQAAKLIADLQQKRDALSSEG